ncbi:unnamed protein product [Gordionus sp. m RMFG-2023]|uniref:dolichyl-diphosphooligosaccharide--protein glycosyltransferase subunit 1-like isoform X1 n=1 Tax=Gordionus sp. m RMFG-2023 TaxID=3053472 RepID=UPI0030E03C2C
MVDKCEEFLFPLKPEEQDNVAFTFAKAKSLNDKSHVLTFKKEKKSSEKFKDFTMYRFDLKAIKFPTNLDISVFLLPKFVKPHPAQIKQNEKQSLLFNDNLYVWLPYNIQSQTTNIKFPSITKIESYTQTKDSSLTKLSYTADTSMNMKNTMNKYRSLTYGPFPNLPAYSNHELTVHYEHDVPIPIITNLDREIEISHWGLISVKELIDIENQGATLIPPFSRFKFQQPGGEAGIALTNYQTILPTHARDVYYKDQIGNISTSNVIYHQHSDELGGSDTGPVEVIIKPRFPLFGGWKTNYILGYNLPTYPYLSHRGADYELKMRFVDHIYHDQVIEKAVVKVIFPEGASIVKVDTPYSVNRRDSSDSKMPVKRHYTYLDTIGRPVLELSKENLIDEHIQDFIVHYKFEKVYMLQEPLLLISVYFLLFCAVIIYVRLDFSITKDEMSETKLRVSGQLDKIKYLQHERNTLYDSYTECIGKFKIDKDLTNFTGNKKKIESELKKIHQKINDLQSSLKGDSNDMADKINELQKLDKTLKEVMTVWVSNAEKAVSGKMTRQIYSDSEKNNSVKKDEIIDKMDSIVDN